jgi:hypothetical protein
MQNDILPPKNWRDTKNTNRKSLSGLTLDKARGRFVRSNEVQKNERFAVEANAKTVPKGRMHHLSTKRKVLVGVLVLLVLAGGGFSSYRMFLYKKPAPAVVQQPVVKAEPPPPAAKTVASPLSGLQVDPSLVTRPVTAVMIENSPDARPQSGLQEAGVVFEAIAEAGITRFMGLFQDTAPAYVGPVRSLRPYYIDFAAPFQASIAHVGGSPEALAQVRSGPYRDIDQFFNGGSYWRIPTRYAPHNVYTSFASLDALNKAKGYTSSQYTPWKRKAEKPLKQPTAQHIDVKMSGPLYNSHYDYDTKTNSYTRAEGGGAHFIVTDSNGKNVVQLHPKVVVTLAMSYSVVDSAGHSNYGTTGSGQMYVFQDGGVTAGTWSKADRGSMFAFKDAAGNPIELDAGQTWVAAVTSPSDVASSP